LTVCPFPRIIEALTPLLCASSIELPEVCRDPRELDYTSWPTMPGILVLLVDRDGTVEGSAGDALSGSAKKWLRVPAGHPPFSVRVKLDEPCPMWEVVSFALKVKGVHSFYVTVGDKTSDKMPVRPVLAEFVVVVISRGVVVNNFDLGERFPRPRSQQRGSLRPRARRVGVLGVGAGGGLPLARWGPSSR